MNKITLDTFIQKYNLGGNVNSVKWISDGKTLSTRFISPDKSLLGELTLVKQTLPKFEVGVYDTPLLSKMLGTLADVETFAVTPLIGGLEFVIGYSDINSNRISIKTQSGAVALTEPVVFNAELFKEVLSANKECSKATLQISEKGLAHIEFNVDDFNVKYWLVSQQTN